MPRIVHLQLPFGIDSHRPILVFHRASGERFCDPHDVVLLLASEGVETGTVRGRNPTTHEQWWVPVIDIAKTGVPYAVALAAVIRAWLKERKGRQVKLQIGSVKISANTADEVDSMLSALTKHAKKLRSIHVTKTATAPEVSCKKNIKRAIIKKDNEHRDSGDS